MMIAALMITGSRIVEVPPLHLLQANEIPRQGPISPDKAVELVAIRIKRLNLGKELSDEERKDIATIIRSVKWDGSKGVDSFIDRQSWNKWPDRPSYNGFDVCVAIGLVTTAWDVSLDRPQMTSVLRTFLACPDPSAVLSRGELWPGRHRTYLSSNWPWRREDDMLCLGRVLIPLVAGNTDGDFQSWLKSWNEDKRLKNDPSTEHQN